MDKQVHIGHFVSSDTLGLSLHDTARSGKKKRLKNILKKGKLIILIIHCLM